MSTMTTVKLSSGYEMPLVGLGTWQSAKGEVEAAVKAALDVGYRHIDGAYIYGNEREIGEALQQVFAQGKVKREDIFITSKLWGTYHHPELVKKNLQESLDRLGRGLELLPKDSDGNVLYDDVDIVDTWKAMEKCVDEGLIRSIGLSNFNSKQIQRIIENSRIKPAVLQVEIHPLFQQDKLVSFCHERNIAVTSYSSFGSPGWATRSGPDADITVLDNEHLKQIAERHKKTVAQVVLRWLIQRRIIVIPKFVSPARIQQNIQVFDFELSDADMEAIKMLDRNRRLVAFYVMRDGKWEHRDKLAPNFPYSEEF